MRTDTFPPGFTELTVNEVVARYPHTMATLHDVGIDTCCGGGLAVAEAARRHGIDLGKLLQALAGGMGKRD